MLFLSLCLVCSSSVLLFLMSASIVFLNHHIVILLFVLVQVFFPTLKSNRKSPIPIPPQKIKLQLKCYLKKKKYLYYIQGLKIRNNYGQKCIKSSKQITQNSFFRLKKKNCSLFLKKEITLLCPSTAVVKELSKFCFALCNCSTKLFWTLSRSSASIALWIDSCKMSLYVSTFI